jgi:hypothetical protein
MKDRQTDHFRKCTRQSGKLKKERNAFNGEQNKGETLSETQSFSPAKLSNYLWDLMASYRESTRFPHAQILGYPLKTCSRDCGHYWVSSHQVNRSPLGCLVCSPYEAAPTLSKSITPHLRFLFVGLFPDVSLSVAIALGLYNL